MTKLIDTRKIKKVILPSYPDSEIELYDTLLVRDVEQLEKIDNNYERGIITLKCLIKSWSFVDEKDEPLEVSKDSLGLLPAPDFTFLMQSIDGVFEEQKTKKVVSSKKS